MAPWDGTQQWQHVAWSCIKWSWTTLSLLPTTCVGTSAISLLAFWRTTMVPLATWHSRGSKKFPFLVKKTSNFRLKNGRERHSSTRWHDLSSAWKQMSTVGLCQMNKLKHENFYYWYHTNKHGADSTDMANKQVAQITSIEGTALQRQWHQK